MKQGYLRKGMAVLIAVSMLLSIPAVVNPPDAKAFQEAEMDANGVYTLEGIGWWDSANPMTKNYDFTDGKWETYMTPVTEATDCCVEFWEGTLIGGGGHWLTTCSLGDCWYAVPEGEDVPAAPEITDRAENGLIMGHIYKISAERDEREHTITVTYYDMNTDEIFFRLAGTDEIFGETLKARILSQVGTIRVADNKDALENIISNLKVSLSKDGKKILFSYTEEMEPDSVEVRVNGQEIDSTSEYVPTESGTYEISVTAKKEGFPDDEDRVAISVYLREDEEIVYDEELIGNLKATKAADAYYITFDKMAEDAEYTLSVTARNGGEPVPVGTENNVKFTDLVSGNEYTVTVTATKEGYVTKTATAKFTYTEEKVDEAGKDVKRTMINKTLGATDYSTSFWSQFASFEIKDNKKYTFVFENHSKGFNTFNNFVLAFANQGVFENDIRGDKYEEYGIVRADNFGWIVKDGQQFQNTTLSGKAMTFTNSITDPAAGSDASWTEWKSIIKDSDVTMNVIRSGSEIRIEASIVSKADASKKIDWTVSLNAANADQSDPNPLYMAFTVDASYLNLKYVDEQDMGNTAEIPTPTQTPASPEPLPTWNPSAVVTPAPDPVPTQAPMTEDSDDEDGGDEEDEEEDDEDEDEEPKVTAPGKVKSLSAKNNKKKTVTLSWKKVSGAAGYQVQCATNKKLKGKKSLLMKGRKVVVKNLKKKKSYYFRVRAYKLNKKKRLYGKWSNTKKVKIKK